MSSARSVATALLIAVFTIIYAGPALAQHTALFVDRPAADHPGEREQTTVTSADGWFAIGRNDQGGVSVLVQRAEAWWLLDFSAGGGMALVPGEYLHATKYSATSFVGLNVAEGSSECAALTGRFLVQEVEYSGDGSVLRFAADAEQHCDGESDRTYVAVRYDSTNDSLDPFNGEYPAYRLSIIPPVNGVVTGSAGDGISCGGDTANCVLTSTSPRSVSLTAAPDSGYIFMGWSGGCSGGESTTVVVDTVKVCEARFEPRIASAPRTLATFAGEVGHHVIGGQNRVFSPANSRWSVTAFNGGSSIDISITAPEGSGQATWFLQLIAPWGTTLHPGTYVVPGGLSFDVPRMFFGGDGRGCAATGSFVIHELGLDQSTGLVTSLAADIVHHCDSAANPRMVAHVQYESSIDVVNFPAPHDVNGDGRLDLFWYHETEGWIATWEMRGTRMIRARLTTPQRVTDPDWRIVGSADFNRDGRPDLFWQHRGSGLMTVWYMDGGTYVGPGLLSNNTVSDLRWQIRTIADFNGDSNPDLLWQHDTSGALVVWIMDGVRFVESRPLAPATVSDTNWKVIGAADFNADGDVDLFWRNQATGVMTVWYMNGTAFAGAGVMSPNTVVDRDWEIRAIADINDDGSPDLLWQRRSDGRLSAWLMNGVTLLRGAAFEPGQLNDSAWRIVGPR